MWEISSAWPIWRTWRRARPGLLHVLLVLAAHAAVLDALRPRPSRPGLGPPRALAMTVIPAWAGTTAARPGRTEAAPVEPAPATALKPAPAPPRRAPAPREAPNAAAAAPARLPAPASIDTATAPAPTYATQDTQAAAQSDDDAPSASPADTPPPLYATRLPPPGRWLYRVQYLGTPAEAVLDWQHDGERYRLHLVAQAPGAARPLLTQSSEGSLGVHGLAPTRFVDRRGGRGARAANFEPDQGRARFSAHAGSVALWPGAQDRLAWLPQLAAIAQARHEARQREGAATAGSNGPVLLQVVDTRGQAGLWRFEPGPDGTAEPGTHWRHEPERADGLRVEVWLDPALGHWPHRLRYTVLRTGATMDWQLVGPAP